MPEPPKELWAPPANVAAAEEPRAAARPAGLILVAMACALLSLFAAVVVVDANRYWARMMALAFGVTNAAGVIALFRELRWGRHAAFVGLVAPGTGFVALLVGFGKGVADVGDSDPTIPFWGAWALFVAGLAWYLYGTKGVRDYYASLRTAASD